MADLEVVSELDDALRQIEELKQQRDEAVRLLRETHRVYAGHIANLEKQAEALCQKVQELVVLTR